MSISIYLSLYRYRHYIDYLSVSRHFLDYLSTIYIYKVCPNENETLAVVRCISIKSQCVNVFADGWRYGIPCYTCALDGFTAISSFQDSFRSWLHDGFLQISTKGS